MGNFCSNVHKSREGWLKTPNKPRRPATMCQNTTIPTPNTTTTARATATTTTATATTSNTNIPLIIDTDSCLFIADTSYDSQK